MHRELIKKATFVALYIFDSFLSKMVDQTGLEPVTTRLWDGDSNQLSYWSNGGCGGVRTLDISGMSRALYQLSYAAVI